MILDTEISDAKATSTLGGENVVGGSTGREGTDWSYGGNELITIVLK